ncbi:hypothetical protein NPIL_450811 [Nephila pilipes]|uniref:Uncharacterized protein n=1 Tax=Nephila pilipes TaxID=299642 RepID=A0A8X6NEX4_NEPPI|nr:hypothetical protein NPIL_450811 [Nephila pilipes]
MGRHQSGGRNVIITCTGGSEKRVLRRPKCTEIRSPSTPTRYGRNLLLMRANNIDWQALTPISLDLSIIRFKSFSIHRLLQSSIRTDYYKLRALRKINSTLSLPTPHN